MIKYFHLAVIALITYFSTQTIIMAKSADLVINNARIYTMDGARSWAEAVAVKGNKIVGVGTNADIDAFIGKGTKIIDAEGKMVLPGLHDTHVHPSGGGLRIMEKFCTPPDNISGMRDETIAYIQGCVERHPKSDGWLVAWNADGVSGADITRLFPNRPVYLESASSHFAVVNDKALEVAGIDDNTPNPPSGIIQRDPETGKATGTLNESAMDFVRPLLPEVTFDDFIAALKKAMKLAGSYGITSLFEATNSEKPLPLSGQLGLYDKLRKEGLLTVRMRTSLWIVGPHGKRLTVDELVRIANKYEADGLATHTAKISFDGSGEGSALIENFPGKDYNGTTNISPQEMNDLVQELDKRGIQVKVHAIGDRAVREALDAFENALQVNGDMGNRHHIDHTILVHEDDRKRFAQLGVAAGFSPLWAAPWSDPDTEGGNTSRTSIFNDRMPINSIYQAGAVVIAGSDWSVSTMNPFEAIEIGMTRINPFHPEYGILTGPHERVSLRAFLEMYTINGAWVMHQEKLTGSIETGKAADIAILDRNLFEIPTDEIGDTNVVTTIFNGKIVYQRP